MRMLSFVITEEDSTSYWDGGHAIRLSMAGCFECILIEGWQNMRVSIYLMSPSHNLERITVNTKGSLEKKLWIHWKRHNDLVMMQTRTRFADPHIGRPDIEIQYRLVHNWVEKYQE